MTTRSTGFVATLALAALLTSLTAASADVPTRLNVQGLLLDDAGSAVTGTFAITFSFYAGETGGDALWTETQTDVDSMDGLFDTTLGEALLNPVMGSLFSENPQLWLGVKIEGGPGVPAGGEAELPRRPFNTVAYAFLSQNSVTADNAITFDGMTYTDVMADVLAAVEAEGYIKPGVAIDQSNLPANGLNEVSNDLVSNQFVDVIESLNVPVAINSGGAFDELVFPDIGTAEKLTVSINVSYTDLSAAVIKLQDPAGDTYTLYDKNGPANQFATTFPEPTATLSGDLTKWVGKNPQGKWTLIFSDGEFVGKSGAINSFSIAIQTLSTKKVHVLGSLFIDKNLTIGGNVTIEGDGVLQGVGNIDLQGDITVRNADGEIIFQVNSETGEVLLAQATRLTVLDDTDATFFQVDPVTRVTTNTMFPDGSRPFLWGRIIDHNSANWIYHLQPQHASNVKTSMEELHKAVEQVLYGDKHGNLVRDIGGGNYANQNNERTRQMMVCFIKNPTDAPIEHNVHVYYASHPWGDGNYASIAVNGSNAWTYTSNNIGQQPNIKLTFPANQTSVVVLKTGTYMWTTNSGIYWNKSIIGFYNNSWNFSGKALEFDYDAYRRWTANQD